MNKYNHKITSISMLPEEFEQLKEDARYERLSVSAFVRGLHQAYRAAKRDYEENELQVQEAEAASEDSVA